jgi:O-antigen/teichoic acid export membrane protein
MRSKQFLLGLLTGYGSILASIIFNVASVPLALHYLDKGRFGLWALALQIMGYLMLLDLGMATAVYRFLANHKDDVNGREYGTYLATGYAVFVTQGAMIAIIGSAFSMLAPVLFKIPSEYATEFTSLLALQSILTGFRIALHSVGSPLWAFQRLEIVNLCGSAGLLLSLPLMWLGLHLGWGIYSLPLANIPSTLLGAIVRNRTCRVNGYYPNYKKWFKPHWSTFKEIFSYGKDVLGVTLGSQLINASQIMIISRVLGLDAAATYSIGTKVATMGQQLFHKVVESAAPGLTEMFVRGERAAFIKSYWDAINVTLALATVGCIALTAANSSFISIWTNGTIQWNRFDDMMLALMLCVTSLSKNFVGLFGIIGNLKPVRILYLLEGILFIPIAIVLTKHYGISGVLMASLVAHLILTFPCSVKRALCVLGSIHPIRVGLSLSISMILVTFAAKSLLVRWENEFYQSMALAFLGIILAGWLYWNYAFSSHVKERFMRYASTAFSFMK